MYELWNTFSDGEGDEEGKLMPGLFAWERCVFAKGEREMCVYMHVYVMG